MSALPHRLARCLVAGSAALALGAGLTPAATAAAPEPTPVLEAPASAAPARVALPAGRVPVRLDPAQVVVDPGPAAPAPRALLRSLPGGDVRVVGSASQWEVTYVGPFPAAARAAFERAVARWSAVMVSTRVIAVTATWGPLPSAGSPDPDLLGSAGPGALFSELGAPDSVGAVALLEAQEGTELNAGAADVVADFNSSQAAWHFGVEAPPRDRVDFETVVLHELGHGLGFFGSAGSEGSAGSVLTLGFPTGRSRATTRFDRSVAEVDARGVSPVLAMGSPSSRLTSALTSGSLFWTGPQGVAAAGGARPRLHAPAVFEDGTSYSHLDEAAYPAGDRDALMTPYLGRGERITSVGPVATGVLADIGWAVLGQTGSEILRKYQSLGGANGILGLPTSVEYAVPGGRAQDFQGGQVLWSAGTGAHEVRGAVLDRYRRTGGPGGPLGLPVSDELAVPGGRAGDFQRGSVYWSPATGAWSVQGLIRDHYRTLGGPGGRLGFPVGDEQAVPGGRASTFTSGVVYWSGPTGARSVQGAILNRYRALGGPGGPLGLPTSDETDTPGAPGGRAGTFQVGGIYWSARTGAWSVQGLVHQHYRALGGPGGTLGLPVTDEYGVPGGRAGSFVGGTVYWSGPTGARAVQGAILNRYLGLGGPGGFLGLPTTDESAVTGGRSSAFTGGRLYWSPATGTQAVRGAILGEYLRLGGTAGRLGLPVTDETADGPNRLSTFTGGRLLFVSATGRVQQV